MSDHKQHMQHAITLGARHQGRTGANPSVGCVLVKNDKIIARGITSPGGRPHAEQNALIRAGKRAENATAYVTLEPCAHEGATPACARLLAEAGIKEVVIAVTDPDARTSGKGSQFLENAGISVVSGVETEASMNTLAGFLMRQKEGRPYYQLKMGISADFKIAEKRGAPTDITGPLSRKYAMLLRSKCDGILVGIDTVLSDNPRLTVRLEGLEDTSPTRIILDRQGRLPLDTHLVQSADKVPVLVFVGEAYYEASRDKFKNTDINVYKSAIVGQSLDLTDISQQLAEQQIGKIMIEGGAKIASSFMNAGLVDEIALFQSTKYLGPNGLNAIEGQNLREILNIYKKSDVKKFGLDTFTRHKKIRQSRA